MTTTPEFDKVALLRLAFKGLDDDELKEMATLTRINSYPADHVLCKEGAFEEVFYVVAEGKAVITKRMGDKDEERVLRIVGKGDLVGEMSMIQKAPRSATVRTSTEFIVLEMEKKDFETMLGRSSRMAIDIIRTTLDRLRENDQMAIQDLQKANEVLRQLDRNKLEFIQVAAHELRTPLTVIKGYVKVLSLNEGVKANANLNEVIDGIVKGTDRMHEIVNMMLDVTRIDTDTMKLAMATVPLKLLIHDLVSDFRKTAADRDQEFIIEQDDDVPAIKADPTLIQKALYHLIVNAIKYTPNGGRITIATKAVIMDNQVPGVEVTIQDTGIGLDAAHHELVFEKFYQVGDVAIHSSGKTSFKGGGPGLGLAIVRGIIRAHNGKVWVESQGYDEKTFPGSTFHVQLPINA